MDKYLSGYTVYPVDAYEHFETGYVDDFGFHAFGKKLKDGYVAEPLPDPLPPGTYDAESFALEAASGGRNTIITDDLGLPSVMVRIPMFLWSDVIDGAPEEPCSAFVVGGKVYASIYISKYLNVVEHGRGYSLPGRNPAGMYEIDEARVACQSKGKGWHLMSNAEWMAIAFWCRKNGFYPHGNNDSGRDFFHHHERGVMHDAGGFGDKHMWPTLTGTGPATWSHDATPYGIYDLNGGLWDMVSGIRLMDGEIQIIPDNDSALGIDESPGSENWRAIREDGALVLPGSPGTYKFDSVNPGRDDLEFVNIPGGVKVSTEYKHPQYTGTDTETVHKAYAMCQWHTVSYSDLREPHLRLKQIGMYPIDHDVADTMLFIRNYEERILSRGGSWFDGPMAGMWELYMREARTWIAQDIGFRASYINL